MFLYYDIHYYLLCFEDRTKQFPTIKNVTVCNLVTVLLKREKIITSIWPVYRENEQISAKPLKNIRYVKKTG